MLLTHSFNIQLGSLYAWLPPILGLIFLIWRARKKLTINALRSNEWNLGWYDLTLIGIVILIFAARFWIIRTIEIPLWGDSYQHAMISQLMVDNNGLFSSWMPYTPYTSLTTHYGFSTSTALLSWFTGMSGTHATLWIGQIVNGFAILTLYPLGIKVSKGNRWAGVGALLAGGLISTYPAFYLNWGRYAQLAGQAVLPVALWLLWEVLDQERWSLRKEWAQILLASLALTGLTLNYYRMPFWYVTFVFVLLLFWGITTYKFQFRKWGNLLFRLAIIGIFGILFFLPWAGNLMESNLASAVEAGMATGEVTSGMLKNFEILKQIGTYIPRSASIIIGITVLWAIIQRNWMVLALPVWFVLLLGYRAGAIIKLPGANMLQVFAILISVYIPVSLILGWFFGEIMHFIEKPKSGGAIAAASILTILIGIWFGWQQRLILDRPYFELVSPTDQKAFSWIETHTPTDARFLVQGFQYHQTAAGSDAGWWLPLLAERENTIPPQYAQFNESPQPPDFTKRVVELYASLRENPISYPESINLLCDWGITHIYNGQGQGMVGGPPLYHPAEMREETSLFTQIYHQDRVSIFTLNQEACNSQP
jgi:hypothetical protein